uniref:Protein translocase n=1 Tax=Solanum tuberosum TaxID=4113 RepID=M1C818_SOLTU
MKVPTDLKLVDWREKPLEIQILINVVTDLIIKEASERPSRLVLVLHEGHLKAEREMEVDIADDVPCSSIAVDSVIRMGTVIYSSYSSSLYEIQLFLNLLLLQAGLIWGSCSGPYDASKLGMFAAIFSSTRCGFQRYRRRNDWVNVLTAGVVAGAAFGAGTRNWKQVAGATGLVCLLCHVAEDSR